MNIICCNLKDRLVLGIPMNMEWSLGTTPCEAGGTILSLRTANAEPIELLGGNPVNLREQTIEIKDLAEVSREINGPAEYVDMFKLSGDGYYLEVGRADKAPEDAALLAEPSEANHENPADSTVFYDWALVYEYMEQRLGGVIAASAFEGVTILEFSESRLKIDAGSTFKRELIRWRCIDSLQEAVCKLYGHRVEIELISTKDA